MSFPLFYQLSGCDPDETRPLQSSLPNEASESSASKDFFSIFDRLQTERKNATQYVGYTNCTHMISDISDISDIWIKLQLRSFTVFFAEVYLNGKFFHPWKNWESLQMAENAWWKRGRFGNSQEKVEIPWSQKNLPWLPFYNQHFQVFPCQYHRRFFSFCKCCYSFWHPRKSPLKSTKAQSLHLHFQLLVWKTCSPTPPGFQRLSEKKHQPFQLEQLKEKKQYTPVN